MIDFHTTQKKIYHSRWVVVSVATALVLFFCAGLGIAQERDSDLRVINLDGLPKDISQDEAGISLLAGLDPAETPRLFADCCALSVTAGNEVRCYEPDMVIGGDLSTLIVAMEQGTPLNFTTAGPTDGPKRCDGAVVDAKGSVTCLDRPVVVDYAHRTVSFVDMPPLKPGDTLILFVEDASPFEGSRENTGRNYDCG